MSSNRFVNSVIGAVVTTVVSFVPLSPVLGGAVAAYLNDSDTGNGIQIGAISGVMATIPMFLFVFFFFSVLSFGAFPSEFRRILTLFGAFTLLYTVLLSTLGGYFGAYLREEKRVN